MRGPMYIKKKNKIRFDSHQGQMTFLSNAYSSSVAHPASYFMEATQLLLLLQSGQSVKVTA